MKKEKEFLRKKFVVFQLKICELTRALEKQQQDFKTREKERDIQLFEILDAFENLNENIKEREGKFDKTSLMLVRNMRSIQGRFIRILEDNHKFPVEFPDNKAKMEYCEVVETQEMPGLENETILSIVRTGYIDKQDNTVLRKARVITVRNKDHCG